MNKFHLIGQNIQTSLSPMIQNFLFQLKGLSPNQCHYSLYEKQNYLLSLDEMKRNNISGISITIPFKQSYASDLLEGRLKAGIIKPSSQQGMQKTLNNHSAQQILAKRHIINTIKMPTTSLTKNNNAHPTSYNTDIYGIKMCFNQDPHISSLLKTNQITKKSTAVIIGAGATAQVFMSYFQQLGVRIIVLNRSVDKVFGLRNKGYINIIGVGRLECGQKDVQDLGEILVEDGFENVIVVNTLPTNVLRQNLGPNQLFRKNKLISLLKHPHLQSVLYMDVNYRDKEQTLLNIIKNKSSTREYSKISIHQISTGLDMLIWQAILQNYIFCHQTNPIQQILSIQQQSQFSHQYSQVVKFLKISAKLA